MAPATSSQRKCRLPCFEIPPSLSLPPVECCLGTKPIHAARLRPDVNVFQSPTSATSAVATIGLAAPIIITVARLLQGFSVGGEFGSAVTFLVEHAGERRGYSASWQWATIGMTSIIASLFGLVLTSQLSHQQLVDWGWRVPYVFGLLVGPAGLYIRSRMAETPEFLNAEKPQRMPISELLRRQPVSVLLALGAAVISNSSYYLLLYIPTYGVKTLHLPAYTAFAATLVGGIILAIFSVVAGSWSDRTSPRTRLMLITAWLFLLG